MQLNASRLKYLQAQDDVVNSMKEATSKELLRTSNNKNSYKKLLKGLIVQVGTRVSLSLSFGILVSSCCPILRLEVDPCVRQSLLRLKEPAVLLRCREVDQKLVESILDKAKNEYAEKAKVQPPIITLDEDVFLPPPPKSADSHEPSWYVAHPLFSEEIDHVIKCLSLYLIALLDGLFVTGS